MAGPDSRQHLPDWLKFKLINSAYTLYTNTILNRAGDFTVMEGGMGGLAGTMDQRLTRAPLLSEVPHRARQVGDGGSSETAKSPDGGILHFVGHYYEGGGIPRGTGAHIQQQNASTNTAAWIIQLAKDYEQTGDREYLAANAERVRRGTAYLKSQVRDDSGIPVGGQTYDDYPHPPICSYTAGIMIATFTAAGRIAKRWGDDATARSL